MKGASLRLLALFIDLLQGVLTLALAALGAVPGTVGGAAVGCAAGNYFLGKIGCLVGGGVLAVIGSHPVINGVLATVTEPLGLVLGFAIDFCISATLGAGLVLLLSMDGMFYPQYIFGWGMVELLPGFNNLFGWSMMTHSCLQRKKAEESGVAGSAAGAFASVMAPGTLIGNGFRTAANVQQARTRPAQPSYREEAQEVPEEARRPIVELHNIDGIRAPKVLPANSNVQPYASAA